MRDISLIFLAFWTLILPSCTTESDAGVDVVSVTLSVDARGISAKSVLGGASFDDSGINDVLYIVTGSDGSWFYRHIAASGSGNDFPSTFRLRKGPAYTVYVLANTGNVIGDIPRDASGTPTPDFYRHPIESFTELAVKGLPMSGKAVIGESEDITIPLRRLVAKLTVTVDKSGMFSGSSSGAPLQSGTISVRQAARAVYPFMEGGSRALSAEDVTGPDGQSDYYVFGADAGALSAGGIVLYVPENCQGEIPGITLQEGKTFEEAGSIGPLATYLEYSADKSGTTDGVSGAVSYRMYLGGNETSSFDVVGNTHYSATLSLSWNGMWEGLWRVVQGTDWTDGRRLKFLDADGNPINYLKVRKKHSAVCYAFFDVAGDGGNGVTGRKDEAYYPYGWYLSGNGSILSGNDGESSFYTIESVDGVPALTLQCLGEESVGGRQCRKLLFAASQAATRTTDDPSLRHHFVMRTSDGRLMANLDLDVEQLPYETVFEGGLYPSYVGQRALVNCFDPETGANAVSDYVFHSSAPDKLRVCDNGDGTAWVECIAPFEAGSERVYVTDSEGDREGNHEEVLSGLVPWFGCTPLPPAVYIDASARLVFTYYGCRADGTKDPGAPMAVVTPPSGIACGSSLHYALVEELMAPRGRCSGTSAPLGFERSLLPDGTYAIHTFIASYYGLTIGGSTSGIINVNTAILSMNGFDSGANDRGTFSTSYKAYNPWKFINASNPSPVQCPTPMNDYTLYREPNPSGTGWSSSPASAPQETAIYTVSLTNAVVANTDNLLYDASFADGSGYLSENIGAHSATPGRVAWDYTPGSSNVLLFRVDDHSGYDWERLWNYLYYELGHFGPTSGTKEAMDSWLSSIGWTAQVSGACSSPEAAWAEAPEGVTSLNPTGITGVTFFLSSNTVYSSWTFRYSMQGLGLEDITTHGAGKVNVVLKIRNPFDNSEQPVFLEKTVAEAYMRLHLYVWPNVTEGPVLHNLASGEGYGITENGNYWTYGTCAYAFTGGGTINGLGYIVGANGILDPAGSEYVSPSGHKGYLISSGIVNRSHTGGSAGEENITGFSGNVSPMYWSFENNSYNSLFGNPSIAKTRLRNLLQQGVEPSPYKFKPTGQLNGILAGKYCFRENDYTLYYDPSGNAGTYSYGGGQKKGLFVIHLGHIAKPYLFLEENGY